MQSLQETFTIGVVMEVEEHNEIVRLTAKANAMCRTHEGLYDFLRGLSHILSALWEESENIQIDARRVSEEMRNRGSVSMHATAIAEKLFDMHRTVDGLASLLDDMSSDRESLAREAAEMQTEVMASLRRGKVKSEEKDN